MKTQLQKSLPEIRNMKTIQLLIFAVVSLIKVQCCRCCGFKMTLMYKSETKHKYKTTDNKLDGWSWGRHSEVRQLICLQHVHILFLKWWVNLANPLVISGSRNRRWFSTGFSQPSLSPFWCFSQPLQSIRVRTAILRVPVETASPASGCATDRKTARMEPMNFNAVSATSLHLSANHACRTHSALYMSS